LIQKQQEEAMNKLLKILIPVVVVVFLFISMGPFYIIAEGEQAVITRFGEIIDTKKEAGLKVKIPIVYTVTKYSKRILSWDGAPKRIQTAENQFIWVDTTARWKISDPVKFYESVTSMSLAYSKLDDVIDSAVRTIIAQNPLTEAVRNSDIIIELQQMNKNRLATENAAMTDSEEDSNVLSKLLDSDTNFAGINKGRKKLSEEMLSNAAKDTIDLGIELIDVVIRQIRYSDDMTQSVYDRMIKERNQIAEFYRSYGEGKKVEWSGKLDNEKEAILSGAYTTSEKLKGDADAIAAAIYNDAYGQDAKFYEFWKAVESYKKTLPGMRKTLSTDMQYFNYLYQSEP
jgi:membrane protease subunit HflC